MKKLSIIIPVFNEERSVGQTLDRVYDVKVPGFSKEIIVIDDGSTDGTKNILKNWEKKIRVIYKNTNEGKGSAVSIGFAACTGDIVLVQDADLEYSPENYHVLLQPFASEQVNVVYGSRFLGSHLSTMFVYAQGNKFVTFVSNVLFNTNITDMETGYKVFRKNVLDGLTIHAKRFDVEPEITVKMLKKGYQIYEVPITYYGRKFSEGKKLTWRDGIVALWTLIKYRFVD